MFRKIIKIHNGLFAEDQFAYLVENYSVFSDLLLSLVNGNHQVLYYLSSRYIGGKRDLEESLDDKKLQIELRRKIEKWIYKDLSSAFILAKCLRLRLLLSFTVVFVFRGVTPCIF